MKALFWIAMVIDFLLLLLCLYETFFVNSNKSFITPAFILVCLMGVALWMHTDRPMLALLLVGILAGLALAIVIMVLVSKIDNWQ